MASSSNVLRYLVLPAIGSSLGIITTVLAALILGGWIMAFSFPVRFWQEVIGIPGPRPGEHSMLDGIPGAGVTDSENGSPVIVVSLSKHLSPDRRDKILAKIRHSPLVRSASLVSAESDRHD